jgi:hypothetical protein
MLGDGVTAGRRYDVLRRCRRRGYDAARRRRHQRLWAVDGLVIEVVGAHASERSITVMTSIIMTRA